MIMIMKNFNRRNCHSAAGKSVATLSHAPRYHRSVGGASLLRTFPTQLQQVTPRHTSLKRKAKNVTIVVVFLVSEVDRWLGP